MKRILLFLCLILMGWATGCQAAPPEATATATLPSAFKGYELYSWQEGGEWRFTLILGTNRVKTLEEIQSAQDAQSADGFVKRTVSGVEALKTLLAGLPPGENVTWLAGIPGEASGGLALPPEEMIAAVEEQARALGLALSVAR